MKANLKRFSMLGRRRNDNKEPYVRIEFKVKGEQYGHGIYFDRVDSLFMFINALRGEGNPDIAFQDLSSILCSVGKRGFSLVTRGSRDEVWVTFPGDALARWILNELSFDDEEKVMPADLIKEISWGARPRTRMVLDGDAKAQIQKVQRENPELWKTLRGCIYREMQALRNSSDGQHLELHVYPDMTTSFYFAAKVRKANGTFEDGYIFNGGWILHELHGPRAGEQEYLAHH